MFLEMVDCDDVPFERSLVTKAMQRLFNVTRRLEAQYESSQVSRERACLSVECCTCT